MSGDVDTYQLQHEEEVKSNTESASELRSIYLIGSLRNEKIPEIGNAIRAIGIEAFDNWTAAGPEADDYWKDYNKRKGLGYREALDSFEARHVFEFDKYHLNRTDGAVLVLPAGKSGHLELGYVAGLGKPTYILFPDGEPEDRYDVMYQFATGGVFFSVEEFLNALRT